MGRRGRPPKRPASATSSAEEHMKRVRDICLNSRFVNIGENGKKWQQHRRACEGSQPGFDFVGHLLSLHDVHCSRAPPENIDVKLEVDDEALHGDNGSLDEVQISLDGDLARQWRHLQKLAGYEAAEMEYLCWLMTVAEQMLGSTEAASCEDRVVKGPESTNQFSSSSMEIEVPQKYTQRLQQTETFSGLTWHHHVRQDTRRGAQNGPDMKSGASRQMAVGVIRPIPIRSNEGTQPVCVPKRREIWNPAFDLPGTCTQRSGNTVIARNMGDAGQRNTTGAYNIGPFALQPVQGYTHYGSAVVVGTPAPTNGQTHSILKEPGPEYVSNAVDMTMITLASKSKTEKPQQGIKNAVPLVKRRELSASRSTIPVNEEPINLTLRSRQSLEKPRSSTVPVEASHALVDSQRQWTSPAYVIKPRRDDPMMREFPCIPKLTYVEILHLERAPEVHEWNHTAATSKPAENLGTTSRNEREDKLMQQQTGPPANTGFPAFDRLLKRRQQDSLKLKRAIGVEEAMVDDHTLCDSRKASGKGKAAVDIATEKSVNEMRLQNSPLSVWKDRPNEERANREKSKPHSKRNQKLTDGVSQIDGTSSGPNTTGNGKSTRIKEAQKQKNPCKKTNKKMAQGEKPPPLGPAQSSNAVNCMKITGKLTMQVDNNEDEIKIEKLKLEKEADLHKTSSPKENGKSNKRKRPSVRNCTDCGLTFDNKRLLEIHRNTTHSEESIKKGLLCETCGKSFQHESSLAYHQAAHTGSRKLQCVLCKRMLANAGSLKVHLQTVHNQSESMPCYVCGVMLKNAKSLWEHVKMMHDKTTYETCPWDKCGKSFTKKFNLKIHMRMHLDEKPICCEFCDYTCRQQNALNVHLKSKHQTMVKSMK